MKFKINQQDLIQPLSNLVRITSKLNPNIQIKPLDDETLELSSTNGSLILEYKIKADDISGEGVNIDAKNFYEVVSRLDKQIEFDNGVIKNGKRKLTIGVDTNINSKVVSLPNKTCLDINLIDFKQVVKNRLFACSKQEYAEALKLVCVNGDEIVTCDSNVLSIGKLKESIGDMLLTQELVNELIKIFECDSVKLIDDNNKLIFFNGDITLIGFKVVAQYPKYQALLPKYSTNKIKLPKDEIIKNLELMSIVADRGKPKVKLIFENDKLQMINAFNSEDIMELDIDYKNDKREIAFNIEYMKNVLKNSDGEVELQFNDPLSAAVFTTENDYTICMPVKL